MAPTGKLRVGLFFGGPTDVIKNPASGEATTPSFATKWLMPRLIRFQNKHPELDVRLSTSNALADFTRQDIDVAVRYGKGRWPGCMPSC